MRHGKKQSRWQFSDRLAQETRPPAGRWLHPVRVILFSVIMLVAAVLVWILPLRPSYSDFEQRELATFPAFSWEALAEGSYFDDISTWFSDTFPAREGFVSLAADITRLFGLHDESIHGVVGPGDEIPSTPATKPTLPSAVTTTTTPSSSGGTTDPTAPTTTTTKNPFDGQSQDLGALLVRGDTAYEYYNFVESVANNYVAAINHAAESLKGTATVYDILIPTSMDVMLPPEQWPSGTGHQGNAMKYMYELMTEDVKTVNVRDILHQKNNEYLYFHTDHHWTARGAYYAYDAFMRAQGKTPTPLSGYKEYAFDGFLGSFYADTQDAGLKLNADTVFAYEPQGNISMTYLDTNGQVNPYNVITDVTDWSARYKYNTFIAGDQPLVTIQNKDLTDGSSIVLVKESFGNAFAPFLATQYQTVYVIDYRHFNGSLSQFVAENGVDTVLFMNNMSATRNNYLVNQLIELVR